MSKLGQHKTNDIISKVLEINKDSKGKPFIYRPERECIENEKDIIEAPLPQYDSNLGNNQDDGECDDFILYPVDPIEYKEVALDKDEFETNEYLSELEAKNKAKKDSKKDATKAKGQSKVKIRKVNHKKHPKNFMDTVHEHLVEFSAEEQKVTNSVKKIMPKRLKETQASEILKRKIIRPPEIEIRANILEKKRKALEQKKMNHRLKVIQKVKDKAHYMINGVKNFRRKGRSATAIKSLER